MIQGRIASPGLRLAILISGGGRTMLNLADRIDSGALKAEIAGVIASRECPGADKARARGFPTVALPAAATPDSLSGMLSDLGAHWIVLAGYLRLLAIPRGFEGRAVNIHPALLPAFGGPGMYGDRVHRAVIAAGCKVSGCTVHLCDEAYDTGPILVQKCCPVLESDTPQSLAARVFDLERDAYPEALAALVSGRVSIEGRRARILHP